MSETRLNEWCALNGATLKRDTLNWNRAPDDIVVDGKAVLSVTTPDGEVWRVAWIKSSDEAAEADRRDSKASALLTFLRDRYPKKADH